ncbi:hypothetical protein MGYG_03524 [Nannizzia gypsea CBS 118893]|uniref:F-box domain-containing protein n=1 Tax=Arthroderma gypseum (strain ATCC MYA-4604 / CBS 118893) TaxID=535722 RepID=E4USF3_ARTGP|nr:hypothetical protein MGYG_03524 [Nannizzia gypsea CBS 118893]EFR00520.1 hypothetical protein MGYG_03524 [Nannizzia gypsea CBS 118893]
MGDLGFRKPSLFKRDPPVAVKMLPEEPKQKQETPVKMWFHVISLSTCEKLCGPYRLRRLLLNRSANDVMFHVAVPNIRPLSDAFMEATEPVSTSAASSPDTSGQSNSSSNWARLTSPLRPASLAATDDMREASPDTAFNILGYKHDGELRQQGTIHDAQAAAIFSPAKDEHPKRKRDEESSSDDSSNDGRPLKISKRSEDDVLSLQSLSSDSHKTYKPQLGRLPVEVYEKIFEELDLLDIIHLGLTSRCFLRLLAKHLRSNITANLGQWAGESIICLGGVTDQNDFPPVLFDDPHLRKIFAPHLNKLADTDHPTLIEFLRECGPLLPHGLRTPSNCGFLHSKWFDDEFYKLPITVISQMIELLCPTEGDYYPPGAKWVLRNLTTKEYVHDPGKGLGFGDIILLRTSWASKPPAGLQINDEAPIHRGIWAGHRFELVQWKNHDREIVAETKSRMIRGSPAGKPWIDVSDDVIGELKELWEFECGPYWQSLTKRPIG